jgi:hypothetical protein
MTNAGSLHARYSQANKLAKSDWRVRMAWMNLGRQILGLPLKNRVQSSPDSAWNGCGRPRNFIAS